MFFKRSRLAGSILGSLKRNLERLLESSLASVLEEAEYLLGGLVNVVVVVVFSHALKKGIRVDRILCHKDNTLQSQC